MDRIRLARELVRVALAFHDRALWRQIRNDQVFAVRLPGESLPMFGSIMGNGGQEFGICLYRGSHALDTIRLMLDGGQRDEVGGRADLVGVSFDSPSRVPDEFATVLREAKFSGRVAPWFLAKEPGKRVRPPRPVEHELMLTVISGVLAAADAGLLRPLVLAPTGPATLWTLTLRDLKSGPDVRAKFEHFAAASTVPSEGPVLLPADVRRLPRSQAHWLFAAPVVPAVIEGDDRSLHVSLIVDAASAKILRMTAMVGVDTGRVASEFFDACRGSNALEREGLPARVDFDQRGLHGALAPVLAELGIEADCLESLPVVDAIVRKFVADLERSAAPGPSDDVVPAAGDLAGWKRLDARAADRVVELVRASNFPKKAAAQYFGSALELDVEEQDAVGAALVDWLMFHYRASAKGHTLAERALAAASLPAGIHALIAARNAASPALYRVTDVTRGESLDLLDLLTGESVCVHDRALSETVPADTTFFGRVYPAGAFRFLLALSAPLPLGSEVALAWLEEQGLQLTPDGLARAPHLLGRLWAWRRMRQDLPVRITNSDGDDVIDIRASFGVADVDALRAELERRPDVQDFGDGLVWVRWRGEEATHLAQFEFIGDELVVSLNSEARLEELEMWLLALPGVQEGDVTRREFGGPAPDDQFPAALASEPVFEAVSEAVAEAMRETLRAHTSRWLDQPIPALGGKTPRQAVGTREGRSRVARMIRGMPDPMGPNGPIRGALPRREMLRELGLDEAAAD